MGMVGAAVGLHPSAERPAKINSPAQPCSLTEKSQLLRHWWAAFDDSERELFVREIIAVCGSFISQLWPELSPAFLEPKNASRHVSSDPFELLPQHPIMEILSFLDPVDLCHCCRVSKRWMMVVNQNNPWKVLCTDRRLYRLSSLQAEEKHANNFVDSAGQISWRSVLYERYRLRRNWIKGRCVVRTFEGHTEGISCVQFDEEYIVSSSSDKTIKVWDMRTNNPFAVMTLSGHSDTVRCLQLSHQRLASGSNDASIKLWDLSMNSAWSSIACRKTMLGHGNIVRCLQMSEDKIISGSYDCCLKIWDTSTGQCLDTLRGHGAPVLCLQYDYDKIISGSADNGIRIWDVRSRCCVMTMQNAHEAAVTCLHFNERQIVTGSFDCMIKFWDIRTGRWMNTLDWMKHEGHTRAVRCLQADRWRIVSGADDKTMKVWNLQTGERIGTLRSHSDGVTCLSFSDFRIVSGSYDKTVKLWDFSMG